MNIKFANSKHENAFYSLLTRMKKPIKVKISTDISEKYFAPDWDEAKVQDIINLALEQYFSKKLP